MTAEEARKYINDFKHILSVEGKEITYVTMSSGRDIHFADMSDEDAVKVALCLQEIEIEASKRGSFRHKH